MSDVVTRLGSFANSSGEYCVFELTIYIPNLSLALPNLTYSSDLEKEGGDYADDGVVEDDGDDEELREGGEGDAVEGGGQVALDEHHAEVAHDRVDVHEDVLDHDVDILAGHVLDEVLVVDPGEHRAADL